MNIKTKEQINEFGDVFLKRIHMLREIWQSAEETDIRKRKALNLWLEMVKRIGHLKHIAIEMSKPMPKK